MNREILFRGKDLETGKWLYGNFIKTSNHTYISTNGEAFPARVESKTVGQYTGLTDKNGVKIFEGDIIAKEFYTNSKRTKGKIFRGVVEYKVRSGKGFGINGEDFKSWAAEWNVKFDFGNYEQKYRSYSWGLFFDCEVVGNIYDNPELLQEGD